MDPELEEIQPKIKESKWKINTREVIHTNPWYRFMHDSGKTDTGRDFDYYYTDIGYSSGAIALTEKGEIILIRQYRYTTNKESLEIPSGGKKVGKDPKEVVIEELMEETGYEGKHVLKIGEFDVANGTSNDIAHLFLITGCKKVGEQDLDETEEGMTIEIYPVEDVFEMVQEGKITAGFTLAALMLAWPHLL